MRQRLGNSDSLLVLKKPFDTVEVLQIAHALTRKWELARQARASMEELDRKVAERTRALEHEMVERARAEENLRQAQKMEAVGQLAAGIAHDFNNLLTVIQGHVGLLLSAPKSGVNPSDSLKQVSFAADRAAALTRQLLVFSRKEVERSKPLDLNCVLTDAGALLHRVIGEHIELHIVLAEEPASLTADETNLDQVIMNLAVNARDAMPDGGVLSLRTSISTLDPESARRHPQARPGTFVCLTVSDTGCGMDTITLSRIFEPFFTTKEIGKGTGIGLATVYGIVQQHHGWIEVVSQPGQGTTFKVFFPRREGQVITPGQTEFTFKLPPAAEVQPTILVVEDEPGVREFIRTVLSMNSFRVYEAADGMDALKLWSRHSEEVDILFTDMVMPNGLSGRGLAAKLQNERPDLKVIYASGYSAETIGAEWLRAPDVEFLPKPYTADAILRAVSSSLSTKQPSLAA
jgi:signal transduction histidine kinase/CheY-like chemotaxis protein